MSDLSHLVSKQSMPEGAKGQNDDLDLGFRYAELCRGYDHKQYQKHLALMPD